MAVFELTKQNKVYVKPDGKGAICVDFVARRLKARPKKIKVYFRTKNPKRSGWTKADYIPDNWSGRVKILPRSVSSLTPAARSVLNKHVGAGYFWFKMEPVE